MQITKATIRYPQGSGLDRVLSGETQSVVTATFEDGTEKEVLRFHDDELAFSPHEFVGLTEEGVRALFHRKDVASQAEVERVTQILLTALQNRLDYTLRLYFKDDPHEQEHSYFTREAAERDLACYDRDALLAWYLIDPDGVILDSN